MKFYDAITEFIFVENRPQKADIIFIPGSVTPELAQQAAQLYHAGYAPYILPSGKYSISVGRFVPPEPDANLNFATECEYLCALLAAAGVPEHAILHEEEATFTWENAIFSRNQTDALGLDIRRAILCCKSFHARRSLMYYQHQFPEAEFFVCPVVTGGISRESWQDTRQGITAVLGELKRCGTQFRTMLAADAGVANKAEERAMNRILRRTQPIPRKPDTMRGESDDKAGSI